MPGGQRHDRRLQPRPERADRRSASGNRALVRARQSPTAQLVRAMLGPDHADRRQLRNLMATEPPPRRRCSSGERATAPTARIRVVIDDLIDLILGPQLATGTPMPGLTARLAPLTLPPSTPSPSRAPPPAAAPASSADPSTAASNSSASPDAPAPQPLSRSSVLLNPGREIENELRHTPHAPRHRSPPPRRAPYLQDSLHQAGIPAQGPDD